MTAYPYLEMTAINPVAPITIARSASFSFYDLKDTGFLTPLNATRLSDGATVTTLLSDSNGYLPDFTTADRTSIVMRDNVSGFTKTLVTSAPVPGAPGAPGTGIDAWTPGAYYPLNIQVVNPNGDLVKVTVAHTSTSTYDASKFSTPVTDNRVDLVEAATVNVSYTLPWGATKTTGPATIVRGTPTYTTPAKFGSQALTGGLLSAASTAPEPVGTSLTVEGWVYAATPPPGTTTPLVAWSHGSKLWVGALPGSGLAVLDISGDTPSRLTSTVNICDGTWHHIAYEVGRINGVTTLKGFWIDGQPVIGTVPIIAAAWAPNMDIGGLSSASQFDWVGSIDEIRITIGNRYKGAFTPQTAEYVVDQRTILLAHMTSNIMDVAVRSYPARPAGVLGGAVTYVGPFQPTDWLTDDRWVMI